MVVKARTEGRSVGTTVAPRLLVRDCDCDTTEDEYDALQTRWVILDRVGSRTLRRANVCRGVEEDIMLIAQ